MNGNCPCVKIFGYEKCGHNSCYEAGREMGKKELLPMGVSEWRAHGEKFGYSAYFDDARIRKGLEAWALMALKEDWFNEH